MLYFIVHYSTGRYELTKFMDWILKKNAIFFVRDVKINLAMVTKMLFNFIAY